MILAEENRMIRAENLTKVCKNGFKNLRVEEGGSFGFPGPNGAGRTGKND